MSKKEQKGFCVTGVNSVAKCNQGAEFQLTHPNGDKLPAFITVAGIDSEAYHKVRRRITDENLRKVVKGKAIKKTALEMEEENLSLLVNCTLGWRGFLNEDGSEYLFNHANAEKLYRENPWISEQVDEAIADRTLFIKG